MSINESEKIRSKEYRINHPDKVRKTKAKSYQKHKEERLAYTRKRMENPLIRKRTIKTTIKWQKNNPEKVYLIKKRYNEKINIPRASFGLWAKTIKILDNYMCKNCDSTDNLHAHHIQPKALYPELSLDLDNGVTLCKKCHSELHGFELY